MSQPILILKGTEATAGTTSGAASNVGSARIVRCVNSGTTARLVTLEESGGTDIGTLTVAGGESVMIRKDATDKIFAADPDILLSAVGVWSG
ncbi:MAG: hypothetical protein QGH83_08375 [Candidatus Pacebacteria bacterium]|jgi:hypothetical protein|nr:hypothetical protein [Candidatus Paceibacterota bacterium]